MFDYHVNHLDSPSTQRDHATAKMLRGREAIRASIYS
jgi:hypothetical protein